MKTFTFTIIETYFNGTKEREISVEAKTEKSALNKIYNIQGNRDWQITLKGE